MKLEAFQTLATVIAKGSLANAARQLNLTPSAVSMQMKQLEEYMGAPLLDRSAARVRPTALALELAQVMDGSLQQLEQLRHKREVLVSGQVHIGIVDTLLPLVLPRVLSDLSKRHPALVLQSHRGKSRALLKQIRSGELDLAVLAQPQDGALTRGLTWTPLFRRDFVLLAPPGSAVQTPYEILRTQPLIGYDRETVTGATASRFLADQFNIKRFDMEFDSVPAIISMVSLGMGASVLQIADPRMLKAESAVVHALGASVPFIQYSALTRNDQNRRTIDAVLAALQQVTVSIAKM